MVPPFSGQKAVPTLATLPRVYELVGRERAHCWKADNLQTFFISLPQSTHHSWLDSVSAFLLKTLAIAYWLVILFPLFLGELYSNLPKNESGV